MPKVTIGIPCFNEEKYIAGTLLSAIQQLDEYSDLEIWVGDNKSTDSSVSKIESVLEAIKSAASHVTLIKHEGIKALDNFWYLFDATDSEYFMCLGGHDQISKGYIQQGVTNMTQSLATGLFCGAHRGLTADGQPYEQEIKYDFSQDNPVERYLQSIAQLDNCYVFHSLFRRKSLMDYDRALAPCGADHLMISHLLWSGKLHQSTECFFSRRYFSNERRALNAVAGKYPHGRNNVEFYQAYLEDLKQLAQPLPDLVGEAVLSQAASLLINRFGLPFLIDTDNSIGTDGTG